MITKVLYLRAQGDFTLGVESTVEGGREDHALQEAQMWVNAALESKQNGTFLPTSADIELMRQEYDFWVNALINVKQTYDLACEHFAQAEITLNARPLFQMPLTSAEIDAEGKMPF